MQYFSERNNLRATIDFTEQISVKSYDVIFNLCKRYFDNIAWRFSNYSRDIFFTNQLDECVLANSVLLEIPNLYNRVGRISVPTAAAKYDQYALLDFVEFMAHSIRDIETLKYNNTFDEYEYSFLNTCDIFQKFRGEINTVFARKGLLYTLTDDKIIERTIVNTPLSKKIQEDISNISENGLQELMEEAIAQFKQPSPTSRQVAVEKLWDALERLKTYYTELDKKQSAVKIVADMADGQDEFIELFDDEFRALTKMGNKFRIRHHETNAIDITDDRHYDYFFNRCLSLIALAIQYLN